MNQTIQETTRLFEAYQFGEAGRQAYEFLWNDFADWYIEIAKTQLAAGGAQAAHTAGMLVKVLDQTLRLLHPFIPFVTEDIWQNLKRATLAVGAATLAVGAGLAPAQDWPEALIIAPWPKAGETDAAPKPTSNVCKRSSVRSATPARNTTCRRDVVSAR